MADNFTTAVGAGGVTFASDEDGSTIHHPYTKLEFGADNTFTKVADVDGQRLPVKAAMAAGATRTAVADSATAVQLLAANANRKGAYILNTSSAVLYVGLGTVDPSAGDFTEQLTQWQAWRVPDCYTGQIKGIWATDPNDGVARVTEIS